LSSNVKDEAKRKAIAQEESQKGEAILYSFLDIITTNCPFRKDGIGLNRVLAT